MDIHILMYKSNVTNSLQIVIFFHLYLDLFDSQYIASY